MANYHELRPDEKAHADAVLSHIDRLSPDQQRYIFDQYSSDQKSAINQVFSMIGATEAARRGSGFVVWLSKFLGSRGRHRG